MNLPMIYDPKVIDKITDRLDKINEGSKPLWGKMNSAQMLAHLNIMFEIGLTDKHEAPNAFVKLMLQAFVKNKLINEVPYKKNSRTSPEMVIKNQPDYHAEKVHLLAHMADVNTKGMKFFDEKSHPVFGILTARDWSNLFYKHIDHHLTQFGV